MSAVALIIIFYQGPCGTFQVMKDHYNDIEHYTPLTVHAVYINSNNDLSKNDIPCCTFQVMKDHYNGIKHYTPLTIPVVSIYLHDDLSKNKIPCVTLQVIMILIFMHLYPCCTY